MYPVFYASGVIYIIVINRNRLTLKTVLESSVQGLKKERINRLRRYAILSSIWSWMLIFNFYICYLIVMPSLYPEGSPFFIPLSLRVTACIFLSHNWVVGGIHVYNFIVKAMTESELEYMDRLLWLMNARDFRPSVTQVCLERKRILQLKESFVTATGIIPVLWFLKEFIYFSGILMNLKATFSNQQYFIMSLLVHVVPLTIIVSTVISLMFVTDDCNNDIRNKIDEVSLVIIEKEMDVVKWQPLLNQLQSEKQFEYRAWNLFDINKYLLLSFVASLITFSALFTQISDGMGTD